jgi:uncharacterized protein YndB with AHSA1/START domain
MEPLVVQLSIDIAAPPWRVWRVLTEPAMTRRYMFGCAAISNWKVGSPLLWRAEHEGRETVFVKGTVLAFEPDRLLRYTTIGVGMGLADEPSNYLTVTHRLTALAGGSTRLDVSQGDFAAVEGGLERFEDSIKNWRQTAAKLKAVAEENDVEETAGL